MIAILDYGIGNILSIANMLKKIGVEAVISSDPIVIKNASKLILPGVGNFDYCMHQLKLAPFFNVLNTMVWEEKVPVLGVCVGCQMLMEKSEEGVKPGLGWLKGSVIKFQGDRLPSNYKVPHMGWTDVKPKVGVPLFENMSEPRFYFTHSYHLVCSNDENVISTAEYGYQFPAAVADKNILGVQFHPEKSHKFGMQLYRNFSTLY